ncbi:MAG TPA: type IIL restriction-modification enzyme MmeI, partial [Acidimicrobiales bacterium]|nr:type IIL restriction-modification enzyme MmeI [Acidimicrobiales bacterium]
LNGGDRWCLWLVNTPPSDLRASRELSTRIAAVADLRSRSKKQKTRDDASRPWEFQEMRQPQDRYIALPRVTSERRRYLPCEYFDPSVIVNDQVFTINDNSLETFGIISSRIFRIWADAISGRLKSDLRLSAEITYNNFPWPVLSAEKAGRIENAADGVLVVRGHLLGEGRNVTLADLYDPTTMPKQLQDAHEELDRAVLSAVGLRADATEAAILAKLFDLYRDLIGGTLLDPEPVRKTRRHAA